MLEVKFYEEVDDALLQYAVIISKYQKQWVFCKHKHRNTLEIPGGHREINEPIIHTAKRELYEETGAIEYTIEPICVYSVIQNNQETFGMLYFANITHFEKELHHEIEKVEFLEHFPMHWTYPDIQPLLIQEYLKKPSK